MFNINDANKIVKQKYPNGRVQKFIEYKNLYVFQIFNDDPLEGEFDPFFSVNKETGEFRDFSIITDGDINVLTELFLKAKKLT